MENDREGAPEPTVLIEDDHTFLSREELDAYREQKILAEYGTFGF